MLNLDFFIAFSMPIPYKIGDGLYRKPSGKNIITFVGSLDLWWIVGEICQGGVEAQLLRRPRGRPQMSNVEFIAVSSTTETTMTEMDLARRAS